jgi:Transposase DDE domain
MTAAAIEPTKAGAQSLSRPWWLERSVGASRLSANHPARQSPARRASRLHNRTGDECGERGVTPIIPIRKGRRAPLSPIPHGTDEWKTLYRRRSAVEREFGRLKNFYGLTLRTRGLRRAQLHADLVMLARLSQVLGRARNPLPQ